MFDTPRIDRLDLRSPSRRLIGTMRDTVRAMREMIAAWVALASWIEWDEIEWSFQPLATQEEINRAFRRRGFNLDVSTVSADPALWAAASRIQNRRLVGRLHDVLNFRRAQRRNEKARVEAARRELRDIGAAARRASSR